jgi:hypothetical protein
MEQSLSPDVEQLLQDLRLERPFDVRKEAVAKLAGQDVSNLQIVNALIAVIESDSAFLVRKKAQKSLQAPAHQRVLEERPDLRAKALKPITPAGQSEQSQSATAQPSDPIPEDIRQAQLRKKRYETFAPVFGVLAVGACLGFFLLKGAKSMTLNDWLEKDDCLISKDRMQ